MKVCDTRPRSYQRMAIPQVEAEITPSETAGAATTAAGKT